jgi:hypothetical protein
VTSPPNKSGHFKVNTEAQPVPGENLWDFTGKLGQDPKVYEGSWGKMCFCNLFKPARGKGVMVPIACFGELAEKVIAEYKAGDWARAQGRFHSYREKKKGPGFGMLKHQLYLCSIEHLHVDEASERAKEAALLESSDNEVTGLF